MGRTNLHRFLKLKNIFRDQGSQHGLKSSGIASQFGSKESDQWGAMLPVVKFLFDRIRMICGPNLIYFLPLFSHAKTRCHPPTPFFKINKS